MRLRSLVAVAVLSTLLLSDRACCAGREVVLNVSQMPSHIYVVKGTTIVVVPGSPTSELSPSKRILLKRGGVVVADTGTSADGRLSWSTGGETLSFHRLTVVARSLDGTERILARTAVDLTDKPLFRISRPKAGDRVCGSIDLTIASNGAVAGERYRLTVDGQPLPPSSHATRRINLLDSTSGTHILAGWTDTADGGVAPLEPLTLSVVPPVELIGTEPAGQLTFSSTADAKITLHVRVDSFIRPTSVSALVDGRELVKKSSSQLDSVTIDVSSLPSGKHAFAVDAVGFGGRHFASSTLHLDLTNDIPVAKSSEPPVLIAVKGEAPAKADPASLTLAWLRRQALVFGSQPVSRRGTIGTARGLVVIARGDVEEGGQTFFVDAAVERGTGGVSLKAEASYDFRNAADEAVEFCQQDGLDLGYAPGDWTAVDITFSYRGVDGHFAGDSAGVAHAVALMSRLLSKPVDEAVAMTGKISQLGDVLPVGGVAVKLDAALRVAQIDTLIIPAHPSAVDEFVSLYEREPEMFTGHRIIVASNMKQVLRQAIIGYDAKTLDQAEELFRGALKLFGKRDNEGALYALGKAIKFTPENLTMRIWQAVIRKLSMP